MLLGLIGCGKDPDPYAAQARARPAEINLEHVQEWVFSLDGNPIADPHHVVQIGKKTPCEGKLVRKGDAAAPGEGEVFLLVLRPADTAPEGDWDVETIPEERLEKMVPITRGKANPQILFNEKLFTPGEYKMRLYYRVVDLEGRNKNTFQDLLAETTITLTAPEQAAK